LRDVYIHIEKINRPDTISRTGITRSVIVYARPPVHIRDFEVRGRASLEGIGRFEINAEIVQMGSPPAASADVRLLCEVLDDRDGGLPVILNERKSVSVHTHTHARTHTHTHT